MTLQPSFEFIRDPERRRPRRPERVFFGVLAGAAGRSIATCGERLICDQGIFGRRIAEDRLHISLSFLGDFKRIPSSVPYGAALAADRIAMPPFDVVLDRAVTLEGGRPGRFATVLLAKGNALHELGGGLSRELRSQRMRAGPLTLPHVTLFYGPHRIRPVEIAPIRLWIDRFHLIHSERGLSRYNLLGCWFLGGDSACPHRPATPPLAFGPMAA